MGEQMPPNETVDAGDLVVPSAVGTDATYRQLDVYDGLHIHWRRYILNYVLPRNSNDSHDEGRRSLLEVIRSLLHSRYWQTWPQLDTARRLLLDANRRHYLPLAVKRQ